MIHEKMIVSIEPGPEWKNNIICSTCGMREMIDLDFIELMNVHEHECEGYTEAAEKFEEGDRVEYSDYGLAWLSKTEEDNRQGDVIRLSGASDSAVVVVWDGTSSERYIDFRFLSKVEEVS